MSNIRGLYDDKNEDDEEEKRRRDANNRFVGGIGAQGGGSGLAVEPNNDENNGNSGPPSLSSAADSIFNIAEQAGAGGSDDEEDASGGGGSGESIRRNITMYRNGFVIDDGPYRRLDDPANASFLQSLARGQTPMELLPGADGNIPTGRAAGGGIRNITVGLVDKRKEDYVETFRSFSGAGATLGANDAAGTAGAGAGGGINTNGIFDPSSLPVPNVGQAGGSTTEGDAGEVTSIAVRMLDGKRKIIKIRLDATIEELAALIVQASNTTIAVSFRIVSGFPPKPIIRADGDNADRAGVSKATTIQDSGLKGAQVQLQKA